MANVGNWTAENCSTIGNGNLILAGEVESGVTFQKSIPAGEVWYSIVEGENREAGIGTFDGFISIVRTTVMATLFNGVFNDNSPAPIPLEGGSVVACTFNATAFEQMIAGIEQNAADILTNASGISQNASDIFDNAAAIGVNAGNISDNTADISQNASDIADKVNRSGDAMTGQLGGVAPGPVDPEDLTRRDYVDAADLVLQDQIDNFSGTTISPTPPVDPEVGDGWWDEELGRQFIYYDDGTSSQWVEEDPPVGSQSIEVAEMVFDQKLGGYLDTGLHAAFAGDLNTILINSTFLVGPSNANLPADWIGQGFCTTTARDINNATQMLWQQNQPGMKWWSRKFIGGVWGAWKLVVGQSNSAWIEVTSGGGKVFGNASGAQLTSVRDNLGSYTVTSDTDLNGGNFVANATVTDNAGAISIRVFNKTATSFIVQTFNVDALSFDASFNVMVTWD